MIPPTYASALGTAGAATGLGVGSLLGGLSDMLSAPRKYVWNKLGLGENGSDFVNNLFEGKVDPHGLPGTILGHGAEMLLDPLNLLFMGGGNLIGKGIGKGLDISKGVAASRAGLAGELGSLAAEKAALGEAGALAKGLRTAPEAIQNWPSPTSALWRHPENAQFVDPVGSSISKSLARDMPTAFGRVNPAAVSALEHSGAGVGMQGGSKGAVLTMGERPSFLRGKGGTMQADPTMLGPQYASRFESPQTLAQMFGPGESRSMASRLGGSADVLHTPLDEVAGTIANRVGNIGLDQEIKGGLLGKLQEMQTPFNLSAAPRISPEVAQRLARLQTGGIAAALTPLLLASPPAPTDNRPEPPEFEQIGVMPQNVTPRPTPPRPLTDFERARYSGGWYNPRQ